MTQANHNSFRVLTIIVLLSERSQSALRIRKHEFSLLEEEKNHFNVLDTKYVKQSSEKKRGREESIETIRYQNSLRKRNRLDQANKKRSKPNSQTNEKTILKILQEKDDHFFTRFQPTKYAQTNNNYNPQAISVVFPNLTLPIKFDTTNELLSRTIEIMSDTNQKITIPIHEGLYKCNTSQKTDLDQKSIPNLCDFKMKNEYSESIEFLRDYKSGYTPIDMQKRNNEEVYEGGKDESPLKGIGKDKTRSHFIRKQQSTLTLPRTCGVSYIKSSESILTQKQPFSPLPPLIFQGSTSCAIGAIDETQFEINLQKKELIHQLNNGLQNSWLPFIISDEEEMRDLLLGKKTKNAKVGFVEGLQNLWPLYVEGAFVLILISPRKLLTEPEVWQAFENKQSYFKIGILSKKSTSGKKAFLKSIKAQPNSNITVAILETEQNEIKQDSNSGPKITKFNSKSQSKFHQESKQSSSQERKISSTLDMLQEQLKDSRTVITMSLRLEMYVQEVDWKQNYTREDKDVLNEIITNLKDRLEKRSLKAIGERFQYGRENKISMFEKKYDQLRIGKCETMLLDLKQHKEQSVICRGLNFLDKKSGNFTLSPECKQKLFAHSTSCSPKDFIQSLTSQQTWKKTLRFPLYYISTRDSFAFDLIQKRTIFKRSNGRQYTRINYYFYPDNVPTNFGSEYRRLFPNLDVGVTAYHGFFTQEEMLDFEGHTFALEKKAFKNKFLQMTVQPSIVSTKIKRTKFFFGYRYMWTRSQLSEPCSYVGAGVRKDVARAPEWTNKISDAMVKENMVENDFINSIAINVYHDGKEGLAQHFDDAVRFKQPIYTLRLFSDARLSFGSQFYGFCNGAFIIPLPRGCILVMEQNSYAANGVKHCVRPCDMTGKSAAIILRQMHSQVVSESSRYDELVDFPAWLSCLTQNQKAISFAQQKRLETEHILKMKEQ